MAKGSEGKVRVKDVLLTIRNRHTEAAPDFEAMVGAGAYASYFENEHGEQWVFVRDPDAKRGAVYGGDNGWELVEVYERSPKQLHEELLAAGMRPGMLDRMLGLLDPLAPSVVLNDSERTWLHTAWHTSGVFGPGDREAELADLGRRLAAQYATPAMNRHANSTDYRAAMQTFCLLVGREIGRRGLDDRAMGIVLNEALQALPEPH